MAGLNFIITGDNSPFMKALAQTQEKIKQTSKQLEREGGNIDQLFSKIAKGAAAIGLGFSATQLINDIVRVRGEFQQLEIAFETMLKSKDKASVLMGQLTETAAKTPFDLQGIAQGAKQLLAYGSQAESVVDELKMLGNVASGVSAPLGDLVYLYGTLRSQGRAYTVDIRQFAGRGIPIYKELSNVLGVTTSELNGLIEAGKVGFPEVEKAFQNMTASGGQFYNLMEKQSESLTGQISNLGDAWDMMLNELGTHTQGIASAGISATTSLVENYDKVGKSIAAIVATYGTYKAALVVARIAQDTLTARMQLAIIAAKAQTAAQAALNVVTKANPYVLLATAIVGVASAMWALRDSTTAAEKAQRRYNDERQKFTDREEERKQKVEELIRVIQDETETEYSKIKAYEELGKYSPALVEAYTREQLATLDLAKSQKVLNEERDKLDYQNIIDNINRAKDSINRYNDAINASAKVPNSGMAISMYYKQVEAADEDLKRWQVALDEYNRLKKEAEENAKPVELRLLEAKADLKQIEDEFTKARQKFEEEQKRLGLTEIVIPLRVEEQTQPTWDGFDLGTWSNFSYWQKRYKDQKSKVSSLETESKSVGKTYRQAFNEAKADYEAKIKAVEDAKKSTEADYKKAVEALETSEKTYKSLGGVTNSKAERAGIKETKDANAIADQQARIVELERKQAQERIRQQADLENQAEQARIDAMDDGFEKSEAQRKLNNKKELEAIERQKQDYIQAVTQAQKEIFDAQEELKVKHNPNYKKKLFDASSVSVDTSLFDAMSSNATKRQANEQIKAQEDAWNEALIQYGTYQQKRKALIDKYDKEIAEAENAGTEWIKTEEKKAALESLDEQYGKSTHAMADLFEDASEKSVASIQKIIGKYDLLVQYMSGTKQSDNTYVTTDELKSVGFTEKDIEKIEKGEIQIKDLTDAVKGLKNELKGKSPWQAFVSDMEKGIQKLRTASGDSQKVGEGIMNIGDSVISFAPALGEFGNNIASIFNVEDSNITEITNALSGLGQTAAGVGKIMSGDIVGGAMSAVGGVASVVGAFRAIHDKKNEKQIQKLQDQIDVLSSSYEKLGREIEKAYSVDASELIGMQNEDLERQKYLIQQQIAEERDKKKTDDDRIKEWQQQIEDINELIEDNEEKSKEAITGTSIMSAIDEFAQAYADAWANGTDAAEASTNAVKNLVKTSLLEFLKKQLSPDVEKFMSDLANYMSDGIISPWEDEQLNNLKDKMDATSEKYYEQVGKYFDEDNTGTQEQQSASSKGFETMSQDTASELNGRFTALQESGIIISDLNREQLDVLRNILAVIPGNVTQASMLNIASGSSNDSTLTRDADPTVLEIRNLMITSTSYLEDIRDYQKKIVNTLEQRLPNIERKLDNL